MQLRAVNQRARALILRYLTGAASVDWLARFASLVDVEYRQTDHRARRAGDTASSCWCFCGAAGRGESLTMHAPQLVLIVEDESGRPELQQTYDRVTEALVECGYRARADTPFDRSFHVATSAEWKTRYRNWLQDPVRTEMYLARPLFDLRPIHGRESLWRDIEATVAEAADRDFLHVLSNDCLANLPPLTFFQDAVVDKFGEQTTVFLLEESALRPVVDVGRVFGMAAKRVTRHLDARALRERPDAAAGPRIDLSRGGRELRILLWQQAPHRDQPGHDRIGIAAVDAQPSRQARPEGWFPVHPAAAGVHRKLALVCRGMTEPSFIGRYRQCFDTTWTDETPIDQVRFVVLDSETTGLNPRTDRLITIGAVAVHGDEILLEDAFDALLQIDENTPAVTVHGITRDETRGGLDEAVALERFLEYVRDGVIVGHHIGHDIGTLDAGYERWWGFRTMNRSLDTMDLTLHLERDGAIRRPPAHPPLHAGLIVRHVRRGPSRPAYGGGDAFLTAQVFLRLLRLAARHGRTTLGRLGEPFAEDA